MRRNLQIVIKSRNFRVRGKKGSVGKPEQDYFFLASIALMAGVHVDYPGGGGEGVRGGGGRRGQEGGGRGDRGTF